MARKISQLSTVSSPVSSDLIPLSRTLSGGWESNAITFSNLTTGIYTDIYSNIASNYVPYSGAISGLNLGSHNLTAHQTTFDHVLFNISATPMTNAEGLLQWNTTDGTLDLGMMGGQITQQVGQELFVKVINKSGAPIANGTPVYFNGRQGNRPKIYPAKSDVHSTSTLMGVTTDDINDDTEGFITTFGYVRQIKTNYSGTGAWGTTWNEGDRLYVSKTVAGQLTNVQPAIPHHSDIVGEVGVIGGPGIGSIFVDIQHHATLEDLSDVNGSPLISAGQIPVWHSASGYFDFDKNINDYAALNSSVNFNTVSATNISLTTTSTSGSYVEAGFIPITINGAVKYIKIYE